MKKLTLFFIAMAIITSTTNAQNPQWIVYDTSNSCLPYNGILSIAIEENEAKWIGAVNTTIFGEYGGGNSLATFDDSGWVIYDTSNSIIPSGRIRSIVIDGNGTKWIGIQSSSYWGETGGLAAFDGTNWLVYDTSNSELPSDWVSSLAIESNGTLWIGTYGGGLTAFVGTNWLVYDTSNSNIPSNDVYCIAIDGNGTKWIGTMDGLAEFNDTNWTIHDTSNSGLPYNQVSSIAIDSNGTIWMIANNLVAFDGSTWTSYYPPVPCPGIHFLATGESGTIWISTYITPLPAAGCGLTSFDGIDWITYHAGNSGLPDNYIMSLAIDQNGTKWIGTRVGGLVAFNENGIPVTINDIKKEKIDLTIYPNPTHNLLTIETNNQSKIGLIKIINIQGKVIKSEFISITQKSINTKELANGLYIIQVQNEHQVTTKKFIKK